MALLLQDLVRAIQEMEQEIAHLTRPEVRTTAAVVLSDVWAQAKARAQAQTRGQAHAHAHAFAQARPAWARAKARL